MGWASHYITDLSEGKTISFNAPNGNSMRPRIVPKQFVTLEPVTADTVLKVGDAVLCRIGTREFLHEIKAVDGERFVIANHSGHVNGTVPKTKIFGRLTG